MNGRLPVLLIAFSVIAWSLGAAADVPAAWTRHRVHLDYGHPPVVISEAGPWDEASCDQLYDEVRAAMVQLGARRSDFDVDERGCYGTRGLRSEDIKFSVLAPADRAVHATGETAGAYWKTAELTGNCTFLEYLASKVLPLVSARNVVVLSRADCERLGVGVRAEVLVPMPGSTADP